MKLTTISIKNFRSFNDHGEIIKIWNLAAFVGKNSSGKSNILQALQLFWGQSILTEDDFYYRETERTISISAEFLVSSDEIIPSLLNYISPNRRLHLRRDFTFSNQKGILISLGKNGYNGIDEMNPFPSKKLSSSKISSFLSSPNSSDLLAYAENLGQTITEQNFYQILESYWCAHFTEYSVHWTTAVADIPSLQQKNFFPFFPPIITFQSVIPHQSSHKISILTFNRFINKFLAMSINYFPVLKQKALNNAFLLFIVHLV